MMMTKPEPKKKTKPGDAVEDLERRLKELSSSTVQIPQAAAPVMAPVTAPAAAAKPEVRAAAPAPVGNKNALLARIMAAQERAKQAQGVSPSSAATDAPPPAFATPPVVPPPSFNSMSTPSMAAPPPAFPSMSAASAAAPDLLSFDTPAPPAFDVAALPPKQEPPTLLFDPHAPPPAPLEVPAAPTTFQAPSAPAFEDLMGDPASLPQPVMPPPVQPAPAASDGVDEETLQAILGMEGLSEAEKQQLIADQKKLMKSFEESKKSSTQQSAADAFESRSLSAAVQGVSGMQMHGQERTREAIADGTAVMVQCTACENWMQVTGSAQLMFCPVCQTVSPVKGSGLTAEEAEQMAADAKLAEQLQKEEYQAADRQSSSSRRARSSAASTSPKESKEQGWMEWMGFGTPAPAPATREIRSSSSRDAESDGLLGGARVAQQAPLFACVTDSINSAANYAMNTMNEDAEGNVHGVDSSSLLAIPDVGRNKPDNQG